MSFVRVGRTQQQQQQHSKVKRPVRPKKTAATKKEWVSTVNDLSVHKMTPAELSHRHEIHKSHNKAAAQWELKEKALKRRLRHGGSPAPLDQASLSIIREVFSDQLLLQDVLARSDRAMAVVKDLFGDAPRRQTGHPRVTMAPNCESDSELPVLQRPDPPTQLSLLSQSLMDQQALNELDGSEEDHSAKDACPSGSSEVIRRTNVRKMKAQSRGRVSRQQKDHLLNYHQAYRDHSPVTPSTSGRAPDQTALNATLAVQRVQSRQSQSEETKEEPSLVVSQVLNPDVPLNQSGKINSRTIKTRKCVSQCSELDGSSVASLNGDQSSLGMLQAMLGRVEAELHSLSPDAAPCSVPGPEQHRTQGLTGFSVSLVSTLGRLVHLFKQREEQAQKEAEERRKLVEELREQQGLVDALTAETMTLREEAASLQAVVRRQTAELEQKLDTIMLAMAGLGLLETHTDPPQDSGVKAAVCQSAPVPEQLPEQTRAPAYPAVLLSPPRQRDNWQHVPLAHRVPLPQQMCHADNMDSFADRKALSSASSLASLPLSSLPTTSSLSLVSDPLCSQFHPQAMLAEIAQLNHQNSLLKAQICQTKGLGSGVGGSPDGCEQRRLSPCSTGRITPQGVEERRSNSTGRPSQKIQSAERDKLAPQASSSTALSVCNVERRLLELNRQSAAARGRLLELIEQQKQSVSSKVSPTGSPVLHSAFSPHAAGGSPDTSLLPPAQELVCQPGGGEKRSSGSEGSFVRFGGETRDGKTQMEKQREQQGWFSLSAHVGQ